MLNVSDKHSKATIEQDTVLDLMWFTQEAQKVCLLFLLIFDEIKERYTRNDQQKALKKLNKSLLPSVEKERKVFLSSLIESSQSSSKKNIVQQHQAKVASALEAIFQKVQDAFFRLKKTDQKALCRHKVQWKLINQVTLRSDPSYPVLERVFYELTEDASKTFRSGIHQRVLWKFRDVIDREWHGS